MPPDVTTRREAIAFLRRHHAQPGAVEAAFAFDGDTGALLDFATGTLEAVELDESKFQHCANVAVLHSHPVNAAALQDDWQYFLERNNQREFIVVGPTASYFLAKPPDWVPNFQWRNSPYEDWGDHISNVLFEWGFSPLQLPTAEVWECATVEVNVRMARQYGLNFSWQSEEAS